MDDTVSASGSAQGAVTTVGSAAETTTTTDSMQGSGFTNYVETVERDVIETVEQDGPIVAGKVAEFTGEVVAETSPSIAVLLGQAEAYAQAHMLSDSPQGMGGYVRALLEGFAKGLAEHVPSLKE